MSSRSLLNYFHSLGARPLHPGIPFEEAAPEITEATEPHPAECLGVIKIDPTKLDEKEEIRYFVDGVQRSVIVFEIDVPGRPSVPVVASHICIGATKRDFNRLSPYILNDSFLVLFPLQALAVAFGSAVPPSLFNVPIPTLDENGNFYAKISTRQFGYKVNVFFSDTSKTFELPPEISISDHDLAAIGLVRQRALDKVREISRAIELGTVYELRKRNPNDFIIIDGPLAREMFLMYGRLADIELSYLGNLDDARRSYDFLRKVIGVVKVVKIVPQRRLEQAFLPGAIHVPVFRFKKNGDLDPNFRHVVCCFVWLRPELAKSIPLSSSMSGGLTRIDVPIPALIDYDPSWREPDFNLDLSPGSPSRERLERILRGIIALRFPVPRSTMHRMLVELYPIAETETWLSSKLLPHEQLRLEIMKL
jgi:hypothetical protein